MLINSPNISGSLRVTGNSVITGSLTVLGGITGAITGSAATASYVEYTNVANKPALVSGSSQVTYSGLTGIPSGIVSGSSQVTYSGLTGIPSGIVSGSAQISGFGIFATTGSNQFNGNQAITGSILGSGSLTIDGCITATGQIVAQTINVQQVTSSIVYSCGSNVFGTSIGNTQQFTGSMFITGSNLNANVGSACFQGSVCAPVAIFSGCVGIGITTPCHKLDIRNASGTGAQTIVSVINKTNDSNTGAFIGFGDAYTDTISPYLFAARVGGTREGAGDGGFMSFYTRPTSGFEYERMRITSTGITCFACRVCMPSATVAGTLTLTASPGVYDANLTYIGTTYNFGPGEASDTVDFKICGGIASTTGNRFGFWTQAGNATPVERLRIDKNGIACFACQVCLSNQLVVQGGGNSIFAWSNCSTTQPGLRALHCNGNDINGVYAKVYAPDISSTVFGQDIGCKAILASEGACNNGLLLGTVNNAPVYIGSNNQNRILLAASGIACFACQVCMPSLRVQSGFADLTLCGTNTSSPHIGGTFSITTNQDGNGRTIIGNNTVSRAIYLEANGNVIFNCTLNAGSVLTVGSIGHYQNYRNTSGCFAIFCASQGAILYVTSMHNNGRSTAIVNYANGITAGAAISVVNQVIPYGPAALSFGVCANGWVYGYAQYGGPMDFYAINMNGTFAWGF